MWQPQTFEMSVASVLAFGVLGIFLLVLGFKTFDWITPRINIQHELSEKHNVAVAVVIAAVIIGISLVISRAIGG